MREVEGTWDHGVCQVDGPMRRLREEAFSAFGGAEERAPPEETQTLKTRTG